MNGFDIIEQKLLRFIRRYYFNRVIRGLFYTVFIAIVASLLLLLLEDRLWMGRMARMLLFWGALVMIVGVLLFFVVVPLLKVFRLGKSLSLRQAAVLIGRHFPEVDDRLLNTLELQALMDRGGEDSDLLAASIVQKTEALRPVPFHLAVDLRKNLRYLRYVVPAVALFLLVFLLWPSFVTQPAKRIIHYEEEFSRPLPFHFLVLNDSLEAVQHSDFTLKVQVEGALLPEAVYVLLGKVKYRLTELSEGRYMYQFRNMAGDQTFRLSAGEVLSPLYTIRVYPNPVLLDFEVSADFPAYTGLEDRRWSSLSDLEVPEGTKLTVKFYTRDCRGLKIISADTVNLLETVDQNVAVWSETIRKSRSLAVVSYNDFMVNPDTLDFFIASIPDAYPTLTLSERSDSLLTRHLFFDGFIRDDYGFSSLRFHYQHLTGGDTTGVTWSEEVSILPGQSSQSFFHSFNPEQLVMLPGDRLSYYFEVCDNDPIHGYKCVQSARYLYELPSMEEVEEMAEASEDALLEDMNEALMETRSIRKELEELSKSMLENAEVTWEEQQKISALMERQQDLQEEMKTLMEQQQAMSEQELEYKDFDPALLEKQQEVQALFEELMSDELKSLFEEVQELMEEMDKERMSEMLDEMQLSNEELEEELDRTLEMFKKLEVEKDLSDYTDKLEQLAEEQRQNAQETERAQGDSLQDALKKQEELNERFEELSRDFDALKEKNDALRQPYPLEDPSSDEEQVKQDQQQGLQQMQQGKQKASSESQQRAADTMQQMSEKMKGMMAGAQMQQMAEDARSLRQTLDNLVQLSFMQEDLMAALAVMKRSDPAYVELIRDQNSIRASLEVVKDSLQALGKRQLAIRPFIMDKINELNGYMATSITFLTEYRISLALKDQQYGMTAMNDLALLLSEAMDQMQQQMQSMSGGGESSSSCPSSGGGKEGSMDVSTMRQLQEQLNKQLEELQQGMKSGQQGGGSQGMSEKLARAAAQQMAIRQQLQQMADQMMEEQGKVSGNMRRMIQEMEQNETDMVNKRITQATLNRQKDIVNRLLQSERAEQQREKEEKRKSKEVKEQKYSNPTTLEAYEKNREKEVEMLKTIPPALHPFFRTKVNDYFYRVQGN
ncbi:MAG: hypothetical protein CSA95_01685 [Bacteroidetes bacterium]|nr:MAG: hypothetical protein CSA95_01685 [Bacteroidota bacterium]